jgi:Mor family transcriptional regulator
MWVNSGSIFGEERRFVDVLRAAGMKDVVFNDPTPSFRCVPGLHEHHNPLDTSAIPKKVVAALKKAAKQNPNPEYSGGVDAWDKRGPRGSGENWFPYFERGLKEGDTLAWTVVPDWVTETLKSLGYDGIKDTGGKQGGRGHEVWIPSRKIRLRACLIRTHARSPNLDAVCLPRLALRFDKFSLEHIGSGEGAQAYGYGLYFAGKKEVAEWYRRKLANGVIPIVDSVKALAGKDIPQEAYDFLRGYGDVYGAIKGLRDTAKSTDPMLEKSWSGREVEYADLKKKYLTAANWLETNKDRIELKKDDGQLYEVEIPDDEHLMFWDKPLSEQPEAVKKALENASLEMRGKTYNLKKYVDASGDNTFTGRDLYLNVLLAGLNGQREVSEYLRSIGIPGHKYLDGTSRSAGEGSYNYVIYDDQAVQIAKTTTGAAKPQPSTPA